MDDLTAERFSWPLWWASPATRDAEDTQLNQGIRRRALSEALDEFEDHDTEVAS